VADYYASFTELTNQSYGLDDSVLLDCFISGLIPELKLEEISQAPHSLLQAMSFAKLFEEKFHPSSLAPKHKFAYFPAKSLTQNISKLSLTTNTNPPTCKHKPTTITSHTTKTQQLKAFNPS